MSEASPRDVDNAVAGFQIARADIIALLARIDDADRDPRSPLAQLFKEASGRKGSATSAAFKTLADRPDVAKAIGIIANPAWIMDQRAGGGTQPFGVLAACNAPKIDKEAVAVVAPSFEGSYFVELFPSPWLYLASWLRANAADTEESAPNHMPPPLSLEATIYLLHAVDLFRRLSYENLLANVSTDRPTVPAKMFFETLRQSIAGLDLRWLLPCFLALTPGLATGPFGKRREDLEALTRADFLLPVAAGKGDDLQFAFGEAGRNSGVEFQRAWFRAVGFETIVGADGAWRVANRGFLAPTALANHLFLVDGEGEAATVNHQAFARDLLDRKMARLLSAGLGMRAMDAPARQRKPADAMPAPSGPPPVATRAAASPPASLVGAARVKKFCPQCGSGTPANAHFCPKCGTPLRR